MIDTERLILRQWQKRDVKEFAEMNACCHVCEFLPKQLTTKESQLLVDKIKKHFKDHGYGLFAVELKSSSEFIGFTGLSVPSFEAHFTPAVEIGWRLAYKHWNQGYATEAAKRVLSYGFENLMLDEIVSFTTYNNLRSQRVMQKIGLEYDENGSFDHPSLYDGHPLRKHVLYRLKRRA